MKAKDNPFRSSILDSLPFIFNKGNMNTIINTLEHNNWKGAIVGPKGTGKTTLLEQIGETLTARGFKITTVRGEKLGILKLIAYFFKRQPNSILLIDAAENLSIFSSLLLTPAAFLQGGVLITAHQQSLMPTLYICEPSLETLYYLTSLIIGKSNTIDRHYLQFLFEENHGNLRNVFIKLYREFAEDQLVTTTRKVINE